MSIERDTKEIVLYICDDERVYREKMEEVCREILAEESIRFQILLGENGKDIFDYPGNIDILILDIDMPEVNGIQVKNWMQQRNCNTSIIFVTNHPERMREAFGLHVFGFVNKGNEKEELAIMLPELIKKTCRYVLIDGKYDSREILYLRAEGVYTELTDRSGGRHIVRRVLKDLEKELAEADYVRTHRSYLVNMNEIKGRITETVTVGQDSIPVSVRLKKKVKETYQMFCRENAGYL